MNKEEILKKLNSLYESEKSKKFVLHLVRAYTPQPVIHKVSSDDGDKKMKCALTGIGLLSIDEILKLTIGDPNFGIELVKDMVSEFKEPNKEKKIEDNPVVKRLNGKLQGFTGNDTDTCLCWEAIEALYSFITNRVFAGDRNIDYCLKQGMKKYGIPEFKS
jgi:hypothetical protein